MTIVDVDLTSMGFHFRADSKYLNDIQAIQRSLALIFRAEMAGVLIPDSSFFDSYSHSFSIFFIDIRVQRT